MVGDFTCGKAAASFGSARVDRGTSLCSRHFLRQAFSLLLFLNLKSKLRPNAFEVVFRALSSLRVMGFT